MDRTCNRCGMNNLVASGYDDEAIICLSCGYTEYVKPKPVALGKPINIAQDASERGKLGAAKRWGSANLTDRQIARIVEWRSQGRTITAIAEIMGRSTSTIHNALSKAMGGVDGGANQALRNGAAKRLGKPPLTDEQREAIRSEYAAGGVTQAALAERNGVTASFVSEIVNAGKPRARANTGRKAQHRLTQQDKLAIQRLYESGEWTRKELGLKFGVSVSRIGQVLAGSPIQRRTLKLDEARAIQAEYEAGGVSQRELGRRHKVSPYSVNKAVNMDFDTIAAD